MVDDILGNRLKSLGIEEDSHDEPKDRSLGDNYLYDGDTFYTKDGTPVRTPGIDVLETAKFNPDGPAASRIQKGEYLAKETTDLAHDILERRGITEAVVTDEVDNPLFKRNLGVLQNPDTKETQDIALLESGVALPNKYSTPGQINAYVVGALNREQRKREGIQTEDDIKLNQLRQAKIASERFFVHERPLALDERVFAGLSRVREKQENNIPLDDEDYAVLQRASYYSPTETQIDNFDRHQDNTATNYWGWGGTAWKLAGSNVVEGVWGAVDLFQDSVGNTESLADAEKARIQYNLNNLPELENVNAFDEEGNWTLDGVTEFASWALTNAITSSPYFGITFVSALLAAPLAPVIGTAGVFAASTVPSSLLYSGMTYNEMEEFDERAKAEAAARGEEWDPATSHKKPIVALGSGIFQAWIERYGLAGVQGKLGLTNPGNIFDKKTRDILVNQLAVKKFKGDRKAAKDFVARTASKELAEVSKYAKAQLARQVSLKQSAKLVGGRVTQGAIAEAATESLQETIGYVTAAQGDFDQDEYKNRILNAAVAGGTLGASFSGVGGAVEDTQTRILADSVRQGSLAEQSRDLQKREERKAAGESYRIHDVIEEVKGTDLPDTELQLSPDTTLEELARPRRGVNEGVSGFFEEHGFAGLFQGDRHNVDKRFSGKFSDIIKALRGTDRSYSGGSDQEVKDQRERDLLSSVWSQEEALAKFGAKSLDEISQIQNSAEVQTFIRDLHEYQQAKKLTSLKAAYNDSDIKLNKFNGQVDAVIDFNQQFVDRERTRNSLIERSDDNVLGYFNRNTLDKDTANNNRTEFEQLIASTLGTTAADAKRAADTFLNFESAASPEDLIDSLLSEGGPKDLTKAELTEKLSTNPKFGKFFNDGVYYNLFADSSSIAHATVKRDYHDQYVKLLALAHANNELTSAEVAQWAKHLEDDLKRQQGTWNQIQSETLRGMLEHTMFFTSVASLPLAALAAMPEFALALRQMISQKYSGTDRLTNEKLKAETRSLTGVLFDTLKGAGTQTAREIADQVNQVGSSVGVAQRRPYLGGNRMLLSQFNLLGQSQSVRRKIDVGNVKRWQSKALDVYFKITQLQGVTNVQRGIRLAGAQDAIAHWVNDIVGDVVDSKVTKQGLVSRDALIHIGGDYDFLINYGQDILDPSIGDQAANDAYFEQQMSLMMSNFVNDAIAMPQKGNRPKFYDDPRLKVFFLFQGFISTLTSKILPRIYRDLTSKGVTLGDRIGALSTILSMLALGFLAQGLRDELKYGEPTPYLQDWDYFQRGLYSSGILGTSERVFDIVNPLYEQRKDTFLDWVRAGSETATPAVSYGLKVGDFAASALWSDDTAGETVYKGLNTTPLGLVRSRFKDIKGDHSLGDVAATILTGE